MNWTNQLHIDRSAQSSHRFQVPLLGCDHVLVKIRPLLLGNLQSVPQPLHLFSVTLTHRLVLCFTFLQLQDQQGRR